MCHSAEKCKRGTLCDFLSFGCKISKQTKGRPFRAIQKTSKKSRIVPRKNPSEEHQREILSMFSRFWTSMFLFRTRSWRFEYVWTSVVQVDVVEQMNKKVDLTRLKNNPL